MEKAIIITAPSGAGKTTLVKMLLNKFTLFSFSVSACTRGIRPNEVDGKDYYFLSEESFQNKIKENAFIEWEEVYDGMFYGTLMSEIERIWALGKVVIFDIDVQGAINLKAKLGLKALAVFIAPPNLEVLKNRLASRGTESKESFEKRIDKAVFELQFQNEMDVVVVNDNLEKAFDDLSNEIAQFLGIEL